MSKYHCRFCNIYIDDNTAQRRQHELGSRHKEAVKRSLEAKKAQKKLSQNEERDLEAQLQAIDEAARESIASEAEAHTPAQQSRKRKASEWKEEHDEGDGDGDDGGIYTVDGQSYMAGDVHIAKLVPGTLCEVHIEEEDKGWMPASISLKHEQEIPHSDARITTFDVTYFQVDETTGVSISGFATGIKPDCLRLEYRKYSPEETKEGEEEEVREVVESTGLGQWESVAIDEEQGEEEEESKPPKQKARGQHAGVSLKTTTAVLNEDLGSGGKLVGFKKKKKK